MKNNIERAKTKFNTGFNCAQSVLSTYCENFGLESLTALIAGILLNVIYLLKRDYGFMKITT